MTKEQFNVKFQELLNMPDFMGFINERAKRLLNSGAVDLESYEDDFQLPKIILCAVLKDLRWQYEPFTNESKKVLKNLEHF